jgi:hypothetical protein
VFNVGRNTILWCIVRIEETEIAFREVAFEEKVEESLLAK